eukprot:TRINITY_DN7072_c0_g1_i5.p1 TRINITY_DN7072_c0_g1~~TRINITY_DN7072_c0_g1_i5.p1  ORF type:complete len:1043 (-),score=151.50 TRINITY_DN7072_c0_g1_i5:759-3887(-)
MSFVDHTKHGASLSSTADESSQSFRSRSFMHASSFRQRYHNRPQQASIFEDRVTLVLLIHGPDFSSDDLLVNPEHARGFAKGELVEISAVDAPELVIYAKVNLLDPAKHAKTQLSLSRSLAELISLQPRRPIVMKKVSVKEASLDHIQFSFKDQFISRSDQWWFRKSLLGSCIYAGQSLSGQGVRVRVAQLLSQGKLKLSGLVTDETKYTFRSRSSQIYWLVELSKEMWEYAADGEMYFDKLLNRHLEVIYRRWEKMDVNHSLTIVFYSRTILQNHRSAVFQQLPIAFFDGRHHIDSFHVVYHSDSQKDWDKLRAALKKTFVRYPMMHYWDVKEVDQHIALPARAAEGNFLEAVNMVLQMTDQRAVDRDLHYTGQAIVVFTAGNGIYNVNYDLSKITKQRMIYKGLGMELISLSKRPLHVVPLFTYKKLINQTPAYMIPYWIDVIFLDDFATQSEESETATLCAVDESSFTDFVPIFRIPVIEDMYFQRRLKVEAVSKSSQYFVDSVSTRTTVVSRDQSRGKCDLCQLGGMLASKDEISASVPEKLRSLNLCTSCMITHRGTYEADSFSPTLSNSSPDMSHHRRMAVDFDDYDGKLFKEAHEQESQPSFSSMKTVRSHGSLTELEKASNVQKPPVDAANTQELPLSFRMKSTSLSRDLLVQNTIAAQPGQVSPRRRSGRIRFTHNLDALISSSPSILSIGLPPRKISGQEASPFTLPSIPQGQSTPSRPLNRPKKSDVSAQFMNPFREGGLVTYNSKWLRWAHLFPKAVSQESYLLGLCEPAILPLTTNFFPNTTELLSNFFVYTHMLSLVPNENAYNNDTSLLLRELISQRLAQRFQLADPLDKEPTPPHIENYYLSRGNMYHMLRYDAENQNIEVRRFVVKWSTSFAPFCYNYILYNHLSETLVPMTTEFKNIDDGTNWNSFDQMISGLTNEELGSSIESFRLRFITIPPFLKKTHVQGKDSHANPSKPASQGTYSYVRENGYVSTTCSLTTRVDYMRIKRGTCIITMLPLSTLLQCTSLSLCIFLYAFFAAVIGGCFFC